MKVSNSFLAISIFLLFFSIGTFGYFFIKYDLAKPIEVTFVDVNFSVNDFIGLGSSKEGLNYGVIPPGMSSERYLSLVNSRPFAVEVRFLVDDDLRDFIYGKDVVFLEPQEKINHSVKLAVPEKADFGNYSGQIKLEIYKG